MSTATQSFVGAQDCLFVRNRDGTANMTAFVQQYTGIASAFTGVISMDNELCYVIMSGRVNEAREPGCYLGQSMLSLGLSMREGSENMILFNDTEVFTDLSHMRPVPIAHKAVHAQCGTLNDAALICAGGYRSISGTIKVR